MNEGVLMERRGPSVAGLLRWSGLALAAGGLLMVIGVVLHPSEETVATILENEMRLVAAHAVSTASYLLILLGLPGLYAAEAAKMGRLGLSGFVIAFAGVTLFAVSGNFGFIAPVLAATSPQALDLVTRYPPVAGLNGVAVIAYMAGFVAFGVAMAKTATLPRSSGVLVALGAPTQLVGFALAILITPTLWFLAVLGSASLGAGLALPGYHLWQRHAS